MKSPTNESIEGSNRVEFTYDTSVLNILLDHLAGSVFVTEEDPSQVYGEEGIPIIDDG